MKIKKIFEIELDEPCPHWLCADNLATALNNYCKGAEANFKVQELARYPDYEGEWIVAHNVFDVSKSSGKPERPLNILDRDIEGNAWDERVRKIEEKIGKFGCLNPNRDKIVDEKNARFKEEISKLGAYVVGAGMCAGCGKVRGSMAIYGGVPCECGYIPVPVYPSLFETKEQEETLSPERLSKILEPK